MDTTTSRQLAERLSDLTRILQSTSDLASAFAQIRAARVLLENYRAFVRSVFCCGPEGESMNLRMRNQLTFQMPSLEGLSLVRSNIINMMWDVWHEAVYMPPFVQLDPSDTVLDAGANIGAFTAYAARQVPNGTVLALEPVPAIFQYLNSNVRNNRLANVACIQKGLLDRRGRTSMWIHPENFGGHSVFARAHRSFGSIITAEFLTLGDLLEDFSLDSIDLMKLDVEGAEFPLLEAAGPQSLRKVKQISMEYHLGPGRRLDALQKLLRDAGYSVQTRSEAADRGMIWATRRARQ